jgi:hypothetical protein
MQFQVPQYIDVEDHIVGPLTLRQFLYIAAGFLVIFSSYFFLAMWLWLPFALVIGGASLALALLKYNGRPLLSILVAAFRYLSRPKAYASRPETVDGAPAPAGNLLARLGLEFAAGTKPLTGRERTVPGLFRRSITAIPGVETLRSVSGEAATANRVDYR